jgi:putative endonuclease
MHYVYVLKSKIKNWIYVGSTKDLKKRFQQHERGEVQSTKAYRPLKIIHYEAYIVTSDATRREIYLKTTKGKSTLRMMLKDSLLLNDDTVVEPVVE